jgi:hypothetical protein
VQLGGGAWAGGGRERGRDSHAPDPITSHLHGNLQDVGNIFM